MRVDLSINLALDPVPTFFFFLRIRYHILFCYLENVLIFWPVVEYNSSIIGYKCMLFFNLKKGPSLHCYV